MIVSHEHKFIFLKTKKTAGTSIELALTELCGPEDVITPLTEIDEARRANGRGPQNWRLHGWWGSPAPAAQAPLVQIHRRRLRLLQSHACGGGARAASATKCGGAISNSPSTAIRGTGRSPSITTATATRTCRRPLPPSCKRTATPASTISRSIPSTATSRSISSGASRTLGEDLKIALERVGLCLATDLPRAKTNFRPTTLPYRDYYDDDTKGIVARWYAREIELLDYEF